MSSEDNLEEPLLERLIATPEPNDSAELANSSKRKRAPDPEPISKRAAKKAKSKKNKPIVDDELDIELGINRAFSRMDNQLLADYIAQRTKRFEDDLTVVELEDKYIPGKISWYGQAIEVVSPNRHAFSHRNPR